MKQLLFVFIAVFTSAILGHGQVAPPFSHQITGLPEAVHNDVNNLVFTASTTQTFKIVPWTRTSTKGGVTTKTSGYNIVLNKPTTSPIGAYGLNFLHDYVYEFGCKYEKTDASGHTFYKARTTNAGAQTCILTKTGSAGKFSVQTEIIEYGQYINQKLVKFSRNTIDSLSRLQLKMTITQLEAKCSQVFTGEYRDPSTNITSIFAYATFDGSTVYNNTYINGKQYSTISTTSLRTALNKTGFGYMFQWRFLNECALGGTVDSDMAGLGNFGQCGKSAFVERTDQLAASINIAQGGAFNYSGSTAIFDSSKSQWVILYMGEKPISGKETSTQCWLNISTGQCQTYAPRG
jgi:hypothetical protein